MHFYKLLLLLQSQLNGSSGGRTRAQIVVVLDKFQLIVSRNGTLSTGKQSALEQQCEPTRESVARSKRSGRCATRERVRLQRRFAAATQVLCTRSHTHTIINKSSLYPLANLLIVRGS